MQSLNVSSSFVKHRNDSSAFPADALLWISPGAAVPYVVILGVMAVIGSLGNLMIIGTLTCPLRVREWREGGARHRGRCEGGASSVYTVGNLFITNLAISDLIVTLIINPFAIIGRRNIEINTLFVLHLILY